MNSIAFTVLGHPEPQGSAKAFVVGGKARITSDNAKMRPWRQQIGWEALRARSELDVQDVFAGPQQPVGAILTFWIGKPSSAPKKRLEVAVKPDLDKLCRAVFDSLAGILFADDAQVVQLHARKAYGLPERAEICIQKIGPEHTPGGVR